MNLSPKQQPDLRNDRNTWSTIASIIAGCALVSTAGAATITQSSNAPTGNILVSQLTVLGPGTLDTARNYTDNGGPVGQSFTSPSDALVGSITVKGRGDSAGSWTTGPQPFDGTEVFGILFAEINGSGRLINAHIETVSGFTGNGLINISDYLTFNLATPIDITAGSTYGFSIGLWSSAGEFNNGGWFGLAHSDTDVLAGGSAFNENTSIANPGGNTGGPRYGFTNPNGFAAPTPTAYDYVFAVQYVPEPSSLALMGLGAFGLIAAYRRRSA